MTDFDAIVVGGGIVGAACAYHLARAGEHVALFDRADEGRATDAGAGIVAPISSGRADDEAWFRLGVEAARYYSDLADELDDLDETGYERTGIVRVALDGADVESFDATADRIRTRAARVGATVEELSASRATELVPALPDVERALYLPGAARVDGRRVEQALRLAGRERGLEAYEEGVTAVRLDGNRVVGIETGTGRYDAPNVVIAGGAWSGRFGDQLGVSIPVEPERGQIAHHYADAYEDETGGWPMVHAQGDYYAVSWPGGRVAVGATREERGDFGAHPTVSGVHAVLSGTMRILPGMSDAELLGVRVGLRPVSSDERPIIGRVPGVDGAFVATGHGTTGLHLGPYTGRIIADLVANRDPPVDVDAFGPERFG